MTGLWLHLPVKVRNGRYELTGSSQFTTNSVRFHYTGRDQMIKIKWNRHRSDHQIFLRTTRTSKVVVQ